MISQKIQDAIRKAAETSDFRPLFAYLARDIELTITVMPGAGGSRQCCGKAAVMARLDDVADAGWRAARRVEMLVDGDRIVALRDEPIVVPTGLLLRCECAQVFDLRNGAITRIALNHELSPVWQPLPTRAAALELL